MTSKIVAPFSGPLTANSLKIWLSSCEDGFDNYQDTHKDATLSAKTRIRLTGSALTDPQMAEWWVGSKSKFLELATWEDFVKKLKDRFMPVNWKMDALEQFYSCNQGKRDFRSYAADLAQCLGTLPSSTISTTIYKYHILFFSHPHLYLRMRALQGFDIDLSTQTPDELIALMGAHRVALFTSAASTPSSAFSPLTEEERAALTAVRGCWNCRGKPGDADWIPHQRHMCPGNSAVGARPGKDYVPSTTPATGIVAVGLLDPDYPVLEEEPEPRDVDTSDEDSD
ncbi:hypothetical protein M413DRAFT_27656 [Hebeloma cylindrosporum]|uniref:Uncharacterized protein n=1 Tax=Hebeloma cylindrosporum TaxID=76867 RepID=A0A0C3BXF8_HEBCY|nr:hypothetical protein M413DRAFT_27656 [Hebeloma cylindrosporum h7]